MVGFDADGDGSLDDPGDAIYGYDTDGVRVSKTVISPSGQPEQTLYVIDRQNFTGYAKPIEEKASAGAAPFRRYIIGHDMVAQIDAPSGLASYSVAGRLGAMRHDDPDGSAVWRRPIRPPTAPNGQATPDARGGRTPKPNGRLEGGTIVGTPNAQRPTNMRRLVRRSTFKVERWTFVLSGMRIPSTPNQAPPFGAVWSTRQQRRTAKPLPMHGAIHVPPPPQASPRNGLPSLSCRGRERGDE